LGFLARYTCIYGTFALGDAMRRMPFIAAIALAAQLGAACAAGVSPDPKSAPAGAYMVEPRHTQVLFAISHFGLTDFYGRFEKISGTLSFVPGAPEKSQVSVAIDMASLNVPNNELMTELAAPVVFDTAHFAKAMFESKSVTRTGPNSGKMTGDLTIRGVTKPVTFDVTFNGGEPNPMGSAGYLLGFHASATIKRADFGLTSMEWSSFVGDDVKLTIEALFQKDKN
jgi:polyisoprenoid-binding protein YceI